MKILLINGSPRENGATKKALTECLSEARKLGANASIISLGPEPRHSCTGCGRCKKNGKCTFLDIEYIYDSAKESDAFIIGAPSHYFGAPGTLISVFSRLFYSGMDAFIYKPSAVIGVGRRGGIYESISDIERFFKFSSSPLISSSYPPILYASDGENAAYDSEGLQNMRMITRNLFWLTKCIEIAKLNGMDYPKAEQKIKTDISSLVQGGR